MHLIKSGFVKLNTAINGLTSLAILVSLHKELLVVGCTEMHVTEFSVGKLPDIISDGISK